MSAFFTDPVDSPRPTPVFDPPEENDELRSTFLTPAKPPEEDLRSLFVSKAPEESVDDLRSLFVAPTAESPSTPGYQLLEDRLKKSRFLRSASTAMGSGAEGITRNEDGTWNAPYMKQDGEGDGFLDKVGTGLNAMASFIGQKTGMRSDGLGQDAPTSDAINQMLYSFQKDYNLSTEEVQTAWKDMQAIYRPMDEQEPLRTLSDGRILPNPANPVWLDKELAEANIRTSSGSQAEKDHLIANLEELQSNIALSQIESFALGNVSLAPTDMLFSGGENWESPMDWAKRMGREFEPTSPEFVKAYRKDVIDKRSLIDGFQSDATLGILKVANTIHGLGGLFGSESAQEYSMKGVEAMSLIRAGKKDTGVLGSVVEEVPSLAMQIGLTMVSGGAGGLAAKSLGAAAGTAGKVGTFSGNLAAVSMSGAQSAAMTYGQLRNEGLSHEEARSKAIDAGVATGLITGIFQAAGLGGREAAMVRGNAANKVMRDLYSEMSRANLVSASKIFIKSLPKSYFGEFAEEGLDEVVNSFLTSDPDTPIPTAWNDAIHAAQVGGIIGVAAGVATGGIEKALEWSGIAQTAEALRTDVQINQEASPSLAEARAQGVTPESLVPSEVGGDSTILKSKVNKKEGVALARSGAKPTFLETIFGASKADKEYNEDYDRSADFKLEEIPGSKLEAVVHSRNKVTRYLDAAYDHDTGTFVPLPANVRAQLDANPATKVLGKDFFEVAPKPIEETTPVASTQEAEPTAPPDTSSVAQREGQSETSASPSASSPAPKAEVPTDPLPDGQEPTSRDGSTSISQPKLENETEGQKPKAVEAKGENNQEAPKQKANVQEVLGEEPVMRAEPLPEEDVLSTSGAKATPSGYTSNGVRVHNQSELSKMVMAEGVDVEGQGVDPTTGELSGPYTSQELYIDSHETETEGGGANENVTIGAMPVGALVLGKGEEGRATRAYRVMKTVPLKKGAVRHYLFPLFDQDTGKLDPEAVNKIYAVGVSYAAKSADLQKAAKGLIGSYIDGKLAADSPEVRAQIRQMIVDAFTYMVGPGFTKDNVVFEAIDSPMHVTVVNGKPVIKVNLDRYVDDFIGISGRISRQNAQGMEQVIHDLVERLRIAGLEELVHHQVIVDWGQNTENGIKLAVSVNQIVDGASTNPHAKAELVRSARWVFGEETKGLNDDQVVDFLNERREAGQEAFNADAWQIGHEMMASLYSRMKVGKDAASINASANRWAEAMSNPEIGMGKVLVARLKELAMRYFQAIKDFFQAYESISHLPTEMVVLLRNLEDLMDKGYDTSATFRGKSRIWSYEQQLAQKEAELAAFEKESSQNSIDDFEKRKDRLQSEIRSSKKRLENAKKELSKQSRVSIRLPDVIGVQAEAVKQKMDVLDHPAVFAKDGYEFAQTQKQLREVVGAMRQARNDEDWMPITLSAEGTLIPTNELTEQEASQIKPLLDALNSNKRDSITRRVMEASNDLNRMMTWLNRAALTRREKSKDDYGNSIVQTVSNFRQILDLPLVAVRNSFGPRETQASVLSAINAALPKALQGMMRVTEEMLANPPDSLAHYEANMADDVGKRLISRVKDAQDRANAAEQARNDFNAQENPPEADRKALVKEALESDKALQEALINRNRYIRKAAEPPKADPDKKLTRVEASLLDLQKTEARRLALVFAKEDAYRAYLSARLRPENRPITSIGELVSRRSQHPDLIDFAIRVAYPKSGIAENAINEIQSTSELSGAVGRLMRFKDELNYMLMGGAKPSHLRSDFGFSDVGNNVAMGRLADFAVLPQLAKGAFADSFLDVDSYELGEQPTGKIQGREGFEFGNFAMRVDGNNLAMRVDGNNQNVELMAENLMDGWETASALFGIPALATGVTDKNGKRMTGSEKAEHMSSIARYINDFLIRDVYAANRSGDRRVPTETLHTMGFSLPYKAQDPSMEEDEVSTYISYPKRLINLPEKFDIPETVGKRDYVKEGFHLIGTSGFVDVIRSAVRYMDEATTPNPGRSASAFFHTSGLTPAGLAFQAVAPKLLEFLAVTKDWDGTYDGKVFNPHAVLSADPEIKSAYDKLMTGLEKTKRISEIRDKIKSSKNPYEIQARFWELHRGMKVANTIYNQARQSGENSKSMSWHLKQANQRLPISVEALSGSSFVTNLLSRQSRPSDSNSKTFISLLRPIRAQRAIELYNSIAPEADELVLWNDGEILSRSGDFTQQDEKATPVEEMYAYSPNSDKGLNPVDADRMERKMRRDRLEKWRSEMLLALLGGNPDAVMQYIHSDEFMSEGVDQDGNVVPLFNEQAIDDAILTELERLRDEEIVRGTTIDTNGLSYRDAVEALKFRITNPDQIAALDLAQKHKSIVERSIGVDAVQFDPGAFDADSYSLLTSIASTIPGLTFIEGSASWQLQDGGPPAIVFIPDDNAPTVVMPYGGKVRASDQELRSALAEMFLWSSRNGGVDLIGNANRILDVLSFEGMMNPGLRKVVAEQVWSGMRRIDEDAKPGDNAVVEGLVSKIVESRRDEAIRLMDTRLDERIGETVPGPIFLQALIDGAPDSLTNAQAAAIIVSALTDRSVQEAMLLSVRSEPIGNLPDQNKMALRGNLLSPSLLPSFTDRLKNEILGNLSDSFRVTDAQGNVIQPGEDGYEVAVSDALAEELAGTLQTSPDSATTTKGDVLSVGTVEQTEWLSKLLHSVLDQVEPKFENQADVDFINESNELYGTNSSVGKTAPQGLIAKPPESGISEMEARQIMSVMTDEHLSNLVAEHGGKKPVALTQDLMALNRELAGYVRQAYNQITTIEKGNRASENAAFNYGTFSYDGSLWSDNSRRNAYEPSRILKGAIVNGILDGGRIIMDEFGRDVVSVNPDLEAILKLREQNGSAAYVYAADGEAFIRESDGQEVTQAQAKFLNRAQPGSVIWKRWKAGEAVPQAEALKMRSAGSEAVVQDLEYDRMEYEREVAEYRADIDKYQRNANRAGEIMRTSMEGVREIEEFFDDLGAAESQQDFNKMLKGANFLDPKKAFFDAPSIIRAMFDEPEHLASAVTDNLIDLFEGGNRELQRTIEFIPKAYRRGNNEERSLFAQNEGENRTEWRERIRRQQQEKTGTPTLADEILSSIASNPWLEGSPTDPRTVVDDAKEETFRNMVRTSSTQESVALIAKRAGYDMRRSSARSHLENTIRELSNETEFIPTDDQEIEQSQADTKARNQRMFNNARDAHNARVKAVVGHVNSRVRGLLSESNFRIEDVDTAMASFERFEGLLRQLRSPSEFHYLIKEQTANKAILGASLADLAFEDRMDQSFSFKTRADLRWAGENIDEAAVNRDRMEAKEARRAGQKSISGWDEVMSKGQGMLDSNDRIQIGEEAAMKIRDILLDDTITNKKALIAPIVQQDVFPMHGAAVAARNKLLDEMKRILEKSDVLEGAALAMEALSIAAESRIFKGLPQSLEWSITRDVTRDLLQTRAREAKINVLALLRKKAEIQASYAYRRNTITAPRSNHAGRMVYEGGLDSTEILRRNHMRRGLTWSRNYMALKNVKIGKNGQVYDQSNIDGMEDALDRMSRADLLAASASVISQIESKPYDVVGNLIAPSGTLNPDGTTVRPLATAGYTLANAVNAQINPTDDNATKAAKNDYNLLLKGKFFRDLEKGKNATGKTLGDFDPVEKMKQNLLRILINVYRAKHDPAFAKLGNHPYEDVDGTTKIRESISDRIVPILDRIGPDAKAAHIKDLVDIHSEIVAEVLADKTAHDIALGIVDGSRMTTDIVHRYLLNHDPSVRKAFAGNAKGRQGAMDALGFIDYGATGHTGRNGKVSAMNAFASLFTEQEKKLTGPNKFEDAATGAMFFRVIDFLNVGGKTFQERAQTLIEMFDQADQGFSDALSASSITHIKGNTIKDILAWPREKFNDLMNDLTGDTFDLLQQRKVYESLRDQWKPRLEMLRDNQMAFADFHDQSWLAMSKQAQEWGYFVRNSMEHIDKVLQLSALMNGIEPSEFAKFRSITPFRWRVFGREHQSTEQFPDYGDVLAIDRASYRQSPTRRPKPGEIHMLDISGFTGPLHVIDDALNRVMMADAYAAFKNFAGVSVTTDKNKRTLTDQGSLYHHGQRLKSDEDKELAHAASAQLAALGQDIIHKDVFKTTDKSLLMDGVQQIARHGAVKALLSVKQIYAQVLPGLFAYSYIREGMKGNKDFPAMFSKIVYSMTAGRLLGSDDKRVLGDNVDNFVLYHGPLVYKRTAGGEEEYHKAVSRIRPSAENRSTRTFGDNTKGKKAAFWLPNKIRRGAGLVVDASDKMLHWAIATPESAFARSIFAHQILKMVRADTGDQNITLEDLVDPIKGAEYNITPQMKKRAEVMVNDLIASTDTSKKAELLQQSDKAFTEMARGMFATFANHPLHTWGNTRAAMSMMRHGDEESKIDGRRLAASNIFQNSLFQLTRIEVLAQMIGYMAPLIAAAFTDLDEHERDEMRKRIVGSVYGINQDGTPKDGIGRGMKYLMLALGSANPMGFKESEGWSERDEKSDMANMAGRVLQEGLVQVIPGAATTLGSKGLEQLVEAVVKKTLDPQGMFSYERAGVTLGDDPYGSIESRSVYNVTKAYHNYVADLSYFTIGLNSLIDPLTRMSNAQNLTAPTAVSMFAGELPVIPRDFRSEISKRSDKAADVKKWSSFWERQKRASPLGF